MNRHSQCSTSYPKDRAVPASLNSYGNSYYKNCIQYHICKTEPWLFGGDAECLMQQLHRRTTKKLVAFFPITFAKGLGNDSGAAGTKHKSYRG